MLDPYWSTTERIRGGGGGGGVGGGNRGAGGERGAGGDGDQRANDEPLKPSDDRSANTLGRTQYDWLVRTLEGTKAKCRFVFIHHLVGGMGGAESRGGVDSSPFFEWGGKNADGTPGFAEHRRSWPMPIHDLLVKHSVSAVFHGHDHLYVSSQRDGVVYQCVPQPGSPRGNTRTAIDAAEDARSREQRGAAANGTVVQQYSITPAIGKQSVWLRDCDVCHGITDRRVSELHTRTPSKKSPFGALSPRFNEEGRPGWARLFIGDTI